MCFNGAGAGYYQRFVRKAASFMLIVKAGNSRQTCFAGVAYAGGV